MTFEEAQRQAAQASALFRKGDTMFRRQNPSADATRPIYMRAFALRAEIEAHGYKTHTDRDGNVTVIEVKV